MKSRIAGIKYKVYVWCIKKLLKWSTKHEISIYKIITEIHKKELEELNKPFEGFNSIKISPHIRISDAIQEVTKDNLKISKN